MDLNKTFEDKVYAGVLGKIIGVYLGRPFEGWYYDRIMKELGPINYYVNDKLDFPIHVTDDDLTGTFRFINALKHFNFDKNIEITLESNPTNLELNKISDFKSAGVNRISLGVQGLNDTDLKYLGRLHNTSETFVVLDL
ncbi:MAG: radical SAM protein, partial [SAR324 cluster bacterium]|nr:radical SAM protein [SAR324 cluster bacterium]